MLWAVENGGFEGLPAELGCERTARRRLVFWRKRLCLGEMWRIYLAIQPRFRIRRFERLLKRANGPKWHGPLRYITLRYIEDNPSRKSRLDKTLEGISD